LAFLKNVKNKGENYFEIEGSKYVAELLKENNTIQELAFGIFCKQKDV